MKYIHTIYNADGSISAEITMENDTKHGPAKFYNDNGTVFIECEYANDKKHGIERRYDENGQVEQITVWNDGEKSTVTNYWIV